MRQRIICSVLSICMILFCFAGAAGAASPARTQDLMAAYESGTAPAQADSYAEAAGAFIKEAFDGESAARYGNAADLELDTAAWQQFRESIGDIQDHLALGAANSDAPARHDSVARYIAEAKPQNGLSRSAARTDFTSWSTVCADNRHLEIKEMPLSDSDMQETWMYLLAGIIEETGYAVMGFYADGTRIPVELYRVTPLRPGQHFAVIDMDDEVLLLGTLVREGASSSGSDWDQFQSQYPYADRTDFPIASNLDGRVSWQVLSVLIFREFDGEVVIVPFDRNGNRIEAEDITSSMMWAGEHFAVVTGYSCLLLGTVTKGAAVDIPEDASDLLTWSAVRDRYPNQDVKPLDIDLPSDPSKQIMWLTMNLILNEDDEDILMIPFQPDGKMVSLLDWGRTPMRYGDFFLAYDTSTGEGELGVIIRKGQSIPPEPGWTGGSGTGSGTSSDYPEPKPGSGLKLEDTSIGHTLTGLRVGHRPTTVSELEGMFNVPRGTSIDITAANGGSLSGSAPVGTGCRLTFEGAGSADKTYTIVVSGDVVGSGVMSMTQLVRMARALAGRDPLSGAYQLAADLNGNGRLDITDMVMEAKLMIGK